jgi:hypothetical protein
MIFYPNLVRAVQTLYPEVTSMTSNTAYDKDGNEVAYDQAAVETYARSQEYIAKRAAEYPPITDYLDGLVKGDQAQMDKYIADCLAVKAKYPKD